MKTNIHVLSYLAQFFLEWEMLQTKVFEKIKEKHILFALTLFRKSWPLWDDVENYCTAVQATDAYGACALRAGYLRLQIQSDCVILIVFQLQQW
jgi:hypothetical protein